MSITFDGKFVYIMGISGAYTYDEAKEILAKLSEIVTATQQGVHRTAESSGSPELFPAEVLPSAKVTAKSTRR